MTTLVLHPVQQPHRIVREQFRAVGLVLRKEGMFFLAFIAIIWTFGIWAALSRNPSRSVPPSLLLMGIVAWAGSPSSMLMGIVGSILPFAVWSSEDPSRRSYHWSMPIARGPHTLIKMGCGWLWLMIGIALYTLFSIGLGSVIDHITGTIGSHMSVAAWQWARPFTTASLVYLLISTAVIGTRHPWRWMGGLFIGDIVTFNALLACGLDKAARVLWNVLDGSYGLLSTLSGRNAGSEFFDSGVVHINVQFNADTTMPLRSGNGPWTMMVWLTPTLLWITISLVGVCIVAYRTGRE